MNTTLKIADFNPFLKSLAGVEPLGQFTFQVLEYAQKSNIQFLKSNATGNWEKLGISNLRGFAPQRREVLVNSDWAIPKKLSSKDADLQWTSFYFLIHDVLHIYFYDRITEELGEEIWQNEDSFAACHLASEAFSVLALDYFVFPETPVKKIGLKSPYGVAAYVKKEWIQSKKQTTGFGQLAALQVDLASQILGLYRQGHKLNFGAAVYSKSSAFKKLVSHEIGYSKKQRVYSANWWNFLNGKKVIESPKIKLFKVLDWEPELLVRFFYELFENSEVRKITGATNYFAPISKTSHSKKPDFRFQNVFSFSPREVENFLLEGFNKNPSFHFLAAQLLCVVGPKHPLNVKFGREIAMLYGKKTGTKSVKNDTARRLVEHLIVSLEPRFAQASYFERDVFYLS